VHPRYYGTFPRVLGKYVREEKVLTLESAVRKMTSMTAERFGLGVLVWSPLNGGWLTGKYRRGQPLPESARADNVQRRYMNEQGFAAVDKLEEVGRQIGLQSGHEVTIAQTAIAWVLANPAVTSAIIGANSVAQLEDTIKGADVALSAEQKAALDAVTAWANN